MEKKDPMEKWGVSNYEKWEHGHGDSETFHAFITYNGKKVLEASNDGWGGPNLYRPISNSPTYPHRDIEKMFYADANKWMELGGCEPSEGADLWIFWYVVVKPQGITPAEYLKPLRETQEIVKERRRNENVARS